MNSDFTEDFSSFFHVKTVDDCTIDTTMSNNLRDYLHIFDNVLKSDELELLLPLLEKSEYWKIHEYYDVMTDSSESFDNELSCIYDYLEDYNLVEISKVIESRIWFAIKSYVHNLKFPWFNNWAGYSQIRYNRYEIQNRMRVHCDHIHSLFDGERKGIPVLTILGALNNNYEGGELVMMNNEVIELKPGSIIVFPSIFLFPHLVKPVIKGTRYSFVSWVW